MDITDQLFPGLQSRFPAYQFIQRDVSEGPLGGPYELAVMIDVIQHIVTKEQYDAALRNIQDTLEVGGHFIIAPVFERSKRHLYYVRFWSESDLLRAVPKMRILFRESLRSAWWIVLQKSAE